MNHAYRIALTCGVTPLPVDVSIFFLWLIPRWEWVAIAGAAALYGGVAAFFVGAVALARVCWLAFRSPNIPRKRHVLAILACSALLLANFAVAGGIIAAVIAIKTRYVVIIQNDSKHVLSGIRVRGGGCEADLGAIPPNGATRHSLWIQQDGSLEFLAVSGTTALTHTIDGYVTNGTGGRTTVVINRDACISVRHQ
jgi:hypothetical protein